jgi:hypothetical protein
MAPPGTNAEARAPTEEANGTSASLVTLVGPIAFVDGKAVPRTGKPIQVPTGCHVVRTDDSYDTMTSTAMIHVMVEPVSFAIPMRGGYNYYVERESTKSSGAGTVRYAAYERDASGNVIQTFGPIAPSAGREACQGL